MNKMNSAAERRPFLTVQTMSLIGLMTALTCVLGPLAIPLPFSPVPISFTNLAVYLAVYVLGMKAGAVSYLVYLLLGMAGLPVFSGFTGGFGKLAGPTGGYLIGFIFMAVIYYKARGERDYHGSANFHDSRGYKESLFFSR